MKNIIKKKNKTKNLCLKCEFYDKKNDSCKERKISQCSKENIEDCEHYLIKMKFVFF